MRLIDADEFKEDLMKLWDYSCVDGITATTVLKQVLHDLDNAPAVQPPIKPIAKIKVETRPKGEWKLDDVGPYCSECELHPDYTSDFCPFCGADMRGEKDGNT